MKKLVALALMATLLFALVPTALATASLEVGFGFDTNDDGFVDVERVMTVTETTARYTFDASKATDLLAKKQSRYDYDNTPYVPITIYLPDGYDYSKAVVYINGASATVYVDTATNEAYIKAAVYDPQSRGEVIYPFKVEVKGTNFYEMWQFEFKYIPKLTEYDNMLVTATEHGSAVVYRNNVVNNMTTTQENYTAYVYNNKLYIDYYGTYYPADLPINTDAETFWFDIDFSFFTKDGVALFDKTEVTRQYLATKKSWFGTTDETQLKETNRVLIPYVDMNDQYITFWVDNGKAYYKRELPIVYRAVEGQNDPKGIYFGTNITSVAEGTTFTPSVYTVYQTSLKYKIVLFDQYGRVYAGEGDGDLWVSEADSTKRTTSAGSKVSGTSIVAGDPGVIWARVYMIYRDSSQNPTATSRVYWDDVKITVTGASAQGTAYSVTARSLNVRKGPGTEYAKISPYNVYRGDVVYVLSITDGWAKIDLGGSVAYVSARYIAKK